MAAHDLENQHKAYSAAKSCSLRTAQRHSKTGHPAWVEFWLDRGQATVAKVKAGAVVEMRPKCAELRCPAAKTKAPELRSPEESVEVAQWDIYTELVGDFHLTNDPVLRAGLASKIADTLNAYWKARQARERADIHAGRYVPAAVFNEAISEASKISAMLQVADREIGPQVNPANPSLGAERFRHWLHTRWNPAIESLIRALAPHAEAAA